MSDERLAQIRTEVMTRARARQSATVIDTLDLLHILDELLEARGQSAGETPLGA